LIGGGVLLLLGLAYRVLPLLGNVSPSEETVLKERQASRYRLAVQDRTALEEKFSTLNRTLEQLSSGVLSGKTPSLAAADIQKIVGEISSRSEVSIKAVRVLKPEQSSFENYITVPVELRFNCNIRQLKEMLYRIDSSPEYLTVNRVQIDAIEGSRYNQIQVLLTVAGIMRKEKS
jgi:hypothetical protein